VSATTTGSVAQPASQKAYELVDLRPLAKVAAKEEKDLSQTLSQLQELVVDKELSSHAADKGNSASSAKKALKKDQDGKVGKYMVVL